MATRQRAPSTRKAPTPLNAAAAEDEIVESAPLAMESLPEVTLHGEPVPLLSREQRIAIAAYQRAERRGFEPGHELEDWLAAEREIDGILLSESVLTLDGEIALAH